MGNRVQEEVIKGGETKSVKSKVCKDTSWHTGYIEETGRVRFQREVRNVLTEKQVGSSASPSWKLNVGHVPTFTSCPPDLPINSIYWAAELMRVT